MAYTGLFPRPGEKVGLGPLSLVKCDNESKVDACGLLQLKHSFDLNELYGEGYGYHSSLNFSMVRHLEGKVEKIESLIDLCDGDVVLDIGSNDATLLKAYKNRNLKFVGIDPSAEKFRPHYRDMQLAVDFFSAAAFRRVSADARAKVVTSISMFYDLEEPLGFVRDIKSILHDDGVWVFEQSYMPAMLETNGYDTICHEHLEYYSLKQIDWIMRHCGMKIVDVEFNDVNGGSFSVVAAKETSNMSASEDKIHQLLAEEAEKGYNHMEVQKKYFARIEKTKSDLLDFLAACKQKGKKVIGLGASTKGNVLLQYCGLTAKDIPCIGEVNPNKYGCVTPGTEIPIIPEDEVLKMKPDYLLVLPWHFKSFFIRSEKIRSSGAKLVFPLPELEIMDLD